MTLLRWQRPGLAQVSPFRHLTNLREEIDRLFESPFGDLTRASQQFLHGWMPAVDLFEDADNLILRAELPGMKKEDINITLHEGLVTLSGERKLEEKHEKAEVYRSERCLGRFQRTLTLPMAVNAEKVKANYKEGILEVMLPKAEEAKPRQIQVHAS